MWSSKHSVFKLADLITEHLPILAEISALVFYHLRDFPTKRSCTFVYGERRKQYPKNWEQLARQCKEQAGKRCQFCRITQGKNPPPEEQENAILSIFMQPTPTMILAIPLLLCFVFVRPAMASMIISIVGRSNSSP